MHSSNVLLDFLKHINADQTMIDISSQFESVLPFGVSFEDELWNVIEWMKRPGNSKTRNIDFSVIKNQDLKNVIKVYFIEKRLLKLLDAISFQSMMPAFNKLDKALGARPLNKITNIVFEEAEELIQKKYIKSTPYRLVGHLEGFSKWLSMNFGLLTNYNSAITTNYYHGRKATDGERENKLIHPHIFVDLINAIHNEKLIEKDKFYIRILALLMGTGFRINELSTLPKNCIIEEQDRIGIRFYPEKKPRLAIRWIKKDWAETVKDAYSKTYSFTEDGRNIAADKRLNPEADWSSVLQDPEATNYFVSKFCHEWTNDIENHMLKPGRAWFQAEQRYVDIITLITLKGSKSAVARSLNTSRQTIDYLQQSQIRANQGLLPLKAKGRGKTERTDWDTDTRVISILRFSQYTNLTKFVSKECNEIAKNIIKDARENFQLKGKVYPLPKYNNKLEKDFQRLEKPILRDSKGNAILWPEEALLVVPQYSLSSRMKTRTNEYQFVDDKAFSRWLSGEARSRKTGNEEDSVFSRLSIVDPRTGKIAKFTSHDIRHWLTTYYLEGGMSSELVGLLFNRSDTQNHTYDQILSTTRLSSLKNSIRDGNAIGHVADTYSNIAEYSRAEAESYLEASTLQMNLMPHGGCSLNWGLESCENHNACFNSQEGVCKSLCLDLNDPETKREVIQMHREAESILTFIPVSSPQYNHYQNIKRNIESVGISSND